MIQKDLDPVRLHINEKLVLVFRSCEHYESRACDKVALQEVNKAILKMGKDHKVKVFEMGDMLTLVTRTDPRWNSYEIDDRFSSARYTGQPGIALSNIFIEEVLNPIKPYIEGIMMGNHEHAYLKHNYMLPSEYICGQMFGGVQARKKHLGYSARVILPIKVQSQIFQIPIYMDHGFGSSVTRTDGGDITSYSKHCQQYNAIINAYGHRHKTWYWNGVRFSNKNQLQEYCVLCAGTFLRTLSEDEHPTYSELRGYPLYPIGCMSVHLIARKRSKDNYYLEYSHKKLPQGTMV